MKLFGRALIIENEYDIDKSIGAFLKDCDLFSEVEIQKSCLNRKTDDIFRYTEKVENIIIATSFMYKDQVIEYCEKFLSLPHTSFNLFNFFVFNCCRQFNEWKDCKPWERESKELRELIINLIRKGHRIYDYFERWSGNQKIKDEFCHYGFPRRKYRYRELLYSEKEDLFYLKNDKYYSLKYMRDEYNN